MTNGDDLRPDPDKLLALVREEEEQGAKGKLRIFLGMAPGVGKTYAMLEAAQNRRKEGLEVVVGLVETHGRQETEELLAGLEIIPRSQIDYKGYKLEELDLDALLKRQPALALIDELAHTNAPGRRHEKRCQDIVELLDHGIDVWTTVNIQHMASLNDVVAQITGVKVQETVPDSTFEMADSIVMVDLPPADLLKRLKDGKVYIPHQAERAAENFFRTGNLIALRELALRAMAQRVNSEVLVYRHHRSVHMTWPTSERIMVCVGPSPSSAKLVRAAKRLATELHAPWIALFVDASKSEKHNASAFQNLRLAEELGAETHVIAAGNIASAIVAFARQHNISKILIGKPIRRSWKDHIYGSPVDQLILLSEEIDVHVIRGDEAGREWREAKTGERTHQWAEYFYALATILTFTGLNFILRHYFSQADLVMIYMLGVSIVAINFSRQAAIMASGLAVLAFDFCFVPPFFSFAVSDISYLFTFFIMLIVTLLISSMAGRLKMQARRSVAMERQAAALVSLSRELLSSRGVNRILSVAQRHLRDIFGYQSFFLMPDKKGKLIMCGKPSESAVLPDKELSIAYWVMNNNRAAGQGAQTLPDSIFALMPLNGTSGIIGVAALQPLSDQAAKKMLLPEQQRLREAFIGQIARSLEVDRLGSTPRKTYRSQNRH